jgi:hypothetical protein
MLIYRLLGEQAEQDFARSWGVSYGVGAAAEWKVRTRSALPRPPPLTPLPAAGAQEILNEALHGAVILVVLERLYLTRSASWLEEHLDYTCLQATIFGSTALGFSAQIVTFWQNTRRLQ